MNFMSKNFQTFACLVSCSSACAPQPTPSAMSENVAMTFAQTCLTTALSDMALSQSFDASRDFSRSDRPLPGPRTTVFDGSDTMVAVTQRFPRTAPPSQSCSIYAQVDDPERLHEVTDTALSKLFPDAQFVPAIGRASDRQIHTGDGHVFRVISSQLTGNSGGLINPILGNIRLIIYVDEQ